ncbi:bifunctional phosphopantothenoylcysteine decarboxylase/phosphopantothenate--cysteine ligase CoaBC [Butyrivibrio sp. MB2005]|uniref:bifunctional phosphopantothenoylcysteine decarboxylase/phosphopantothenate--cysteine ligase CoaBC n=1 Tax=Butyrivibrio sp. MB2005 TaxID=1280678 RepID=UPI0004022C05|nr:bifunctional phosphopantothenoylcysteine decarboxylase/phosphopantothenate--cysteine ligase CoaBC [Butyrivibrio sp. MB2005]
MLKGKNIVLGVTGGIAGYKACELTSLLVKQHANVQVIMTENATKFVTPITFEQLTGNKTLTDTFDRNFIHSVEHISVADKADMVIIAPATANIIAKLANGTADDMLTTTVLACRCPKAIAPSMNTAMLENPVTQDNIDKLRHYGWEIIEPDSGRLACGTVGKGKLPSPESLLEVCLHTCTYDKDMTGKTVLVTAGPTREALDPVRYLTNHSTGKMGYAIAKAASRRGADVILVSGPTSLPKPPYMEVIDITSAQEMYDAVMASFDKADIVIKAAAVADYRPATIADNKIKKSDGDMSIPLERTTDIIKTLGEKKRSGQFICGFSMETENMIENSKEKLAKKNLDMIAANNVKVEGAGFGTDTNILTLITADEQKELPIMSKDDAANALLDSILEKIN